MSDTSTAAQRLRGHMTACRVHFTWLGLRRTLTPEQKARAADAFQANGRFLSAGKKLLDTGHPAVRKVTGVKSAVQKFWHGVTVPFPEAGVRLIPQRRVEDFAATMAAYKDDLDAAVEKLDAAMPGLKASARARLGDLFSDGDYPDRLNGLFAVEWDFPSVEPPAYLQDLAPEIYEEERRRVQERFEEAVRLTEEAFIAEFGKLVGRLVERLGEPAPGEPKRVFRDSAVENLTEFFTRFKELSVRNNDELDRLVERAKDAVRNVEPQDHGWKTRPSKTAFWVPLLPKKHFFFRFATPVLPTVFVQHVCKRVASLVVPNPSFAVLRIICHTDERRKAFQLGRFLPDQHEVLTDPFGSFACHLPP